MIGERLDCFGIFKEVLSDAGQTLKVRIVEKENR
jgi:hypothetical protein